MKQKEKYYSGDPELKTPQKPFDRAFFEKLPKTDLHVHLDGSMRIDTILELAQKDKIDIGADTRQKLVRKLGPGKMHSSLNEYLEAFDLTLKVMQT